MLTKLLNAYWKTVIKQDLDVWSEEDVEWFKSEINELIENKIKPFLEWLIKEWHIEKVPSEKKSWPDINDYIKYIATTEDPVDTLINMLKTDEKK